MTKLHWPMIVAAAVLLLFLTNPIIQAKSASSTSRYDQGWQAYDSGHYARAFEIWQALAEQGHELAQVNLGEGTDLARPISDLAFGLNRKSLAIVISDLLDDEASILKGLQHLRFKGNDVIVFHIMDNAELNFPFEQTSEFEDSESHETVAVIPQTMRETYLEELEKFCGFYRQKCRAGGIDYCLLNTAKPLDIALSSYLSKRAKQF